MLPDALPAPRPWSRPQLWNILGTAFTVNCFDAIDFMLLALALPVIIAEFHLSLAEGGLLGTATLIGVGVSGVLVGWFCDRFGRKRALLACVVVFSTMTAAAFLVGTWSELLVLRFVAGFGLGGIWSVLTTYIAETWPKERRSQAATFVMSAWPTGIIVAALLVRQFLPTYGWRAVFLCGGAALLMVPYIILLIPESPGWVPPARDLVRQVRRQASVAEIFGPSLRWGTVFGTLACTLALIAYWGVNTWLPTYLVKERGLSSSTMAGFIILINVGTIIGYQFFGWVADRLGGRTALVISLTGGAIMLPVYGAIRDPSLLFWLGPVAAFFFAFPGLFGAYLPRLYPAQVRSMGAGFCFNVGRGLSAFAPFVLGGLAGSLGLSMVISVCGAGFLLAALCTLLLPDVDLVASAPLAAATPT